MGIGQLYNTVLTELGAHVFTVDMDPKKNADFLNIDDAIRALIEHGKDVQQIDTVHICTPNWTHESIAMQVAPYAKIVFIEKPGVKTEERLNKLHQMFPETRFMMVKNNMWRNNIAEMQRAAEEARSIHLNWINYDRIPNPGTWFTTKNQAYGGVSRDLMPHLLSLVVAIYPTRYKTLDLTENGKSREWSLHQIKDTAYGKVKTDGIHNVDDLAWMSFYLYSEDGTPEKLIRLEADWRTMESDEKNIVFDYIDREEKFELDLCPEYAYKNMIQDCFDNLDNKEYWANQYEIDLWIHRMVSEI